MRTGMQDSPRDLPATRFAAVRHQFMPVLFVVTTLATALLAFIVASPTAGAASRVATACSGGNREVFGGNVMIEASEWICGQARAYGGDVAVFGRVGGDVVAVGGNTTIDGEVDGGVTAIGGNVTLLSHARVAGDVQSIGGRVVQTPGSLVGGQVMRESGWQASPSFHHWPFLLDTTTPLLDLLFWALAAAVCSLLLPAQLLHVRHIAEQAPAQSLFMGVGTYIAAVIVGLVLAFTCIGIPLALLIGVGIWGGTIFGTAALGLWLGQLLVRNVSPRDRTRFALASMLGTVLLAAAANIPCLGVAIQIVVTCTGIGAVARALLASHRTTTGASPARG